MDYLVCFIERGVQKLFCAIPLVKVLSECSIMVEENLLGCSGEGNLFKWTKNFVIMLVAKAVEG